MATEHRHTEGREPTIVVMGVQGCGKSTVGQRLAHTLGRRFLDADDLHSAAARAKMAAGTPLTDDDRLPWLTRVASNIATADAGGEPLVVACSALKRSYRELLRGAASSLVFLELEGSRELIAERLSRRNHEFMPPGLLDSQFAALEPLADDEAGWRVSLTNSVDEIVASSVARFRGERA